MHARSWWELAGPPWHPRGVAACGGHPSPLLPCPAPGGSPPAPLTAAESSSCPATSKSVCSYQKALGSIQSYTTLRCCLATSSAVANLPPPNPVLWWMGWQWVLTFISGPSFVSWRNCELTWDKRRASLQSDGPSCCISILSTLRFCDVVLHAASGRLYNRDAQSFATLLIQISISHILLSYTLVKFLGVVGVFFGNIAQQFIVKQWKQEKNHIPILTSQSARMKRASIMITELHKRPYETTGDNSLKWY